MNHQILESVPERKKRDPQRSAVYQWEDWILSEAYVLPLGSMRGETLNWARNVWQVALGHFAPECPRFPTIEISPRMGVERITFAADIRAIRNGRPPRLRGSGGASGSASVFCHHIKLSRWATRATLLHELAHLLTPKDAHGPRFCAALIYLYECHLGVPLNLMRVTAPYFGVEVAGLS